MTHLFVRAGCGQYFYGDWYASNFNNLGYRPWVSYTSHFRNYDPLLTYYSSRRSSFDKRYNVVQHLARQHNFYVHNRDYRPRPTYKSQHKHARTIEQRIGSRGHGKDYILRSSYVSSYKDLRKRSETRGRQASSNRHQPGHQKFNSNQHRKVAEAELRNSRRRQEQLASMQRDRKRREQAGQNRVAVSSSGRNRTQRTPASRESAYDILTRKTNSTGHCTSERREKGSAGFCS